jgi:hypothetical protein
MASIELRQESPTQDLDYLALHIPDSDLLGNGTFTLLLAPGSLENSTPIVASAIHEPAFEITVTIRPASSLVIVHIGHADGSPPRSRAVHRLPKQVDVSRQHRLCVTFSTWHIIRIAFDGIPLPLRVDSTSYARSLDPLYTGPSTTQVLVSPALEGCLVPQDLLTTQGSLETCIHVDSPGVLFHVSHPEYSFRLDVQEHAVTLQRNESSVCIPIEQLVTRTAPLFLAVVWEPAALGLHCAFLDEDHPRKQRVRTRPTLPPKDLIQTARKWNLLPAVTYRTEADLRQRVYVALGSVQSAIDQMHDLSIFYDIIYERNRITSRAPKKETNIHPIILALLTNQMFVANIEVVPEYTTAAGDLDLAFIGCVDGRGMCCICAEFKNAHSEDINHGLAVQLPEYMRKRNAAYGAYCVLWYKGGWYDRPRRYDRPHDLLVSLHQVQSEACLSEPLLQGVRLFAYDLSRKQSASSLTQ